MTDRPNPDPAPLVTLVTAIVEKETATMAALQALLQFHPPPRFDAEIEADFDNLPV